MGKIYEALRRAEQERTRRWDLPVAPEESAFKEIAKEIGKDAVERQKVFDGPVNKLIVTAKHPLSQATEQFKKACIHILQCREEDKRVFAVTSSLSREGKTTVCANLAVSLSQLPETPTILVDADLRNPRLHEIMDIFVDKGLRDYLEDNADVSEICYKTPFPRLLAIPAGGVCTNPAEVITSAKMRRLIEELKNRYPDAVIIVDSTPLLLTAEPSTILHVVDSIILVVLYGKTKRQSLERVLHSLDKRKVLGIIFSQVDSKLLEDRYK